MILETIVLAVAAFALQYFSGSIGMGYGTILAPLLVIAGFDVKEVVPAVVISQLLGNTLLSVLHHRWGNADFSWGSKDSLAGLMLGAAGGVGAFTAAALIPAVPEDFLKAYMAAMMASLGIAVLVRSRRKASFKRGGLGKLAALSAFASFNKGLTGGGFGPLVTAGQVILGSDPKSAVAITSFAELIAGVVAACVYVYVGLTSLTIILPLTAGTIASAPLTAFTVKKVSGKALSAGIGYGMIFLSAAVTLKALMP